MTASIRSFIAAAALAALVGCASFGSGKSPSPQSPTATRIVTHVVTHDAKLIGSAVGGVRVSIRDAATGRLLAEGRHEGGTGDTRRIMQEPRKRGEDVFTAGDGARYEATITLTEPTMVDVTAEGPLNYPDQMARASKRLWLFPGRDVTGDGVVLEMHGYVIDLLAPDTTAALRASSRVPVRARVRMLCSCPTQPGGMWEVGDVVARLVRDGMVVREGKLAYAGEGSTYAGEIELPAEGRYALEILAANPGAATFGMVRRWVNVAR